jgi:hypothetical protein
MIGVAFAAELEKQRNRLKNTAAYKAALSKAAQVSVREVQIAVGTPDVAGGAATPKTNGGGAASANGAGSVALDIAEQNLDDIFDTSGRQLGEGLHVDYTKARVKSSVGVSLAEAKLELFAVLNDH